MDEYEITIYAIYEFEYMGYMNIHINKKIK